MFVIFFSYVWLNLTEIINVKYIPHTGKYLSTVVSYPFKGVI